MEDLVERPAWREKLQSVCSIPRFIFILQGLSDEQRNAVCNMGFGGLLSLSFKILRGDLLRWLIPQFHPIHKQFVLHGQLVDITPRDVNIILGLAIGGEPVEPIGRPRNIANVCKDLGIVWGREVRIKDLEEIVQSRVANDRWRQAFVLYALGTFLCPTAHGRTRDFYLQHVAEVDTCRGFAWGPHIVEVCKRTLTAHRTTGKKIMGCCMPFLQIWYFEHTRLNPPVVWEPNPQLPLLKKWCDQECRVREKSHMGLGFGAVHVIMDIYPDVGALDIISDWRGHLEAPFVRNEANGEQGLGAVGDLAPNDEPHAVVMENEVARELPDGANDETGVNLLLGATSAAKQTVQAQNEAEVEQFPQTTHGAVFGANHDTYERQVAALKKELEEFKEKLEQSIYQNSMLKVQLEVLTTIVGRIKSTANSEATLGSQTTQGDGHLKHLQPSLVEAGCTSSVATNDDPVHDTDALTEQQEEELSCTEVQTLPTRDFLCRSSRQTKELRLLKSPYETLGKRRKGAVMTRVKRPKVTEDEIQLHPELCWNHKSIVLSLKKMTDADEQLVNYAFLLHGDDSEHLFKCGDIVLTRKDFHALAPGHELSTTVMDAYILLAHADQMSTREGVQRWYFDSLFMAYLTRDGSVPRMLYMQEMIKCHLGNAGWIVVPICKDFHWFSFAVDLVCQKVYYLDSLHCGARERMEQSAPQVALEVERIFSDIGEPKDVTRWELMMASGMPHQTNGVDCGIFTINNMRCFTGIGSVTYNPIDISIWRRQYASYILGHLENELQKQVWVMAAKAKRKTAAIP